MGRDHSSPRASGSSPTPRKKESLRAREIEPLLASKRARLLGHRNLRGQQNSFGVSFFDVRVKHWIFRQYFLSCTWKKYLPMSGRTFPCGRPCIYIGVHTQTLDEFVH